MSKKNFAKKAIPISRPSAEEAMEAVKTLLAFAGDDPSREGLVETPKRVIKAYGEFFAGYDEDPEEVLSKTFEQVEIPKSVAGEQYKLLKENLEVTISFMEDKPISIELPYNIECTIETTDAAIKNQTASSSYKPALLDCGIKINVPPFVESGEKIIIDTRTLEYVKRVN